MAPQFVIFTHCLFYISHSDFWQINAYSVILTGAEEGEEDLVTSRRLQYLKLLHFNIPMSDLDTKGKKKSFFFFFGYAWEIRFQSVFVHSLSVFLPGFQSWRWWRGWMSRARCTTARCKTAWCCWWTECKCCWCNRHSYSCPAPDRRFQRPTRRWIPVRHVPGAPKYAAVIRRTSWKKETLTRKQKSVKLVFKIVFISLFKQRVFYMI